MDKLTDRFAHQLRELGLKPGATLGILLENGIDQIASWPAADKAGAIWVPLNTALRGHR